MNDIKTWGNLNGFVVDESGDKVLCSCNRINDAEWIASRLNMASKLEQMTYDFATGKSDGQEIVDYVKRNIS